MNRIIWAGDSTVKYNKIDSYPQTGLSQGMLLYLKEETALKSFAENGRSTKSFIDQGRLDQIDSYIQEGDFLFIEFGHNDEKKEDPLRYCAPQTDFKENLLKFINVARKHNAYPVLITPIARRLFELNGKFKPGSHGDYPKAILELGHDENVPVIDMTNITEGYLDQIGDFASRPMYVYPKDNTHLQMYGAVVYAGFIAKSLNNLGSPYKDLLLEQVVESTTDMKQIYSLESEN